MMSIDSELVALIYGLYLWECIYWLKDDQTAYVKNGATWTRKRSSQLSFTLLGRMPVFRNPFSIWPGIVISANVAASETSPSNARSIKRAIRLFRTQSFELCIYSALSGCFLLFLLPAFIMMNMIVAHWKTLVAILLILHLAVLSEFYRTCAEWRSQARKSFVEAFIAISLSPLTAVRCSDAAMRWKFSAFSSDLLDLAICPSEITKPKAPQQSRSVPSSSPSPEA